MRRNEIELGMYVQSIDERALRGVVKSLPDEGGTVIFKTEQQSLHEMHVDDLQVYDPHKEQEMIRTVQRKLDEAALSFEQAFQALRDASEEANGMMWDLRDQDLIDAGKLESVVAQNGWSTSSLWC